MCLIHVIKLYKAEGLTARLIGNPTKVDEGAVSEKCSSKPCAILSHSAVGTLHRSDTADDGCV